MADQSRDDAAFNVAEFLSDPVETLDVEYSCWMDITAGSANRASIAKELIALANHGGGYLVFGFREDSQKQLVPDTPLPPNISLKDYSGDAINSIIRKFVEPPFQCVVRNVVSPKTNVTHPIVIVPGHHRVPIRSKRGAAPLEDFAYYCRTPGPNSERPQTGRDWDDIISQCINVRMQDERDRFVAQLRPIVEDLHQKAGAHEQTAPEQPDLFGQFIQSANDRFAQKKSELGPNEHPDRYDHGVWTFAYHIVGGSKSFSAREMLGVLAALPRYTGWRPWNPDFTTESMRPYAVDGMLECWVKDSMSAEPAQSDFWRVDPRTLMFVSTDGYDDDGTPKVKAGKFLDPSLVVWRVGERVMHALNLARKLKSSDLSIDIRIEWTGLRDRKLDAWSDIRVSLYQMGYNGGRCHVPAVQAKHVVVLDPEVLVPDVVVVKLLEPLFEAFDFMEVPHTVIKQQLDRMVYRTG